MVAKRVWALFLCVVAGSGFVLAFVQARSMRLDAPIVHGEKYIVVIIPSYKNSRWCIHNIESVFRQQYNNYFVIYIDDCSPDDTYKKVRSCIAVRGQKHRVLLMRNDQRRGALYNLYHAIHACPDRAIIITLDGDDWLHGDDVFQTINRAYDDPNVWLTYGQFEEFPRRNLGICHPMPDYVVQNRSYRRQEWFTSHLRTFYAGLFKKVRQEDLLLDGEFFSVAWDQAFLFPMLEMAHGRIKFIDKILYIYNQANPLNDFKRCLQKQLYCEQLIRMKKRYMPLALDEGKSFCVVS